MDINTFNVGAVQFRDIKDDNFKEKLIYIDIDKKNLSCIHRDNNGDYPNVMWCNS